MSFGVGGSTGFTVVTTFSVSTAEYDPVTRGNQEFDGRLFYEILPDTYTMLADYDLLPRMWEGFVEVAADMLLNFITVDAARSILDVPLDYQRKYQHFDLLFEEEFVNDPQFTTSGKGSTVFSFAATTQAVDATWRTRKTASDRAVRDLRSGFDQRATTRWGWRATYSKLTAGSYGLVGYLNSDDDPGLANGLYAGVGNDGRVCILQVDSVGGPNMLESAAGIVPLDTEVDVAAEYNSRTHVVTVSITRVSDGVSLLSGFTYDLLTGPSGDEFEVDSFGFVNIDVATFGVTTLTPVVGAETVASVTRIYYLDPSVDESIQMIPAVQDTWREPSVFWENEIDYDFYPSFFAFREQPEDFLLAEYVSYNRELVERNFGKSVGIVGENTASYRSQVRALHSVFWKGPTRRSVKLGTQALLGLPFAEEAGTVVRVNAALTGTIGEIVVEGDTARRAYQYPNTVTASVGVGDTVSKFDPLTTGVEIRDWKSHPDWFKPFLGTTPVASASRFSQALNYHEPLRVPGLEIQKYHMFMVAIDSSLYDASNLAAILNFFDAIRQTWKMIVMALTADFTDEITPDDSLALAGTLSLWDHGGSSAILAPRYGDPGYPPFDYDYGGVAPAITYGMYHPSFPDDPIEATFTNLAAGPRTITIGGTPRTVPAGGTWVENIP